MKSWNNMHDVTSKAERMHPNSLVPYMVLLFCSGEHEMAAQHDRHR
jgi:hypothetical protein